MDPGSNCFKVINGWRFLYQLRISLSYLQFFKIKNEIKMQCLLGESLFWKTNLSQIPKSPFIRFLVVRLSDMSSIKEGCSMAKCIFLCFSPFLSSCLKAWQPYRHRAWGGAIRCWRLPSSVCPNVSTTPITAMGFSAMFTFQLDNTKR